MNECVADQLIILVLILVIYTQTITAVRTWTHTCISGDLLAAVQVRLGSRVSDMVVHRGPKVHTLGF